MKNPKYKLILDRAKTDYLHLTVKAACCQSVNPENMILLGAQLALNGFFRKKMDSLYHPSEKNTFELEPVQAWGLHVIISSIDHSGNENKWFTTTQCWFIQDIDDYLDTLKSEFPMPEHLHIRPTELPALMQKIQDTKLLNQ